MELIDVPRHMIERCETMREALRLCWKVSGLELKEMADDLGIDVKHLSRMLGSNEDDPRHFPPNKLVDLMVICRNAVPLRWLSIQMGEEPATDLRRQLITERSLFLRIVREIQGAPTRLKRHQQTLSLRVVPQALKIEAAQLAA